MSTSCELTALVHSSQSLQSSIKDFSAYSFSPLDSGLKKSGTVTFMSPRFRAAQSNRTFSSGMPHACTVLCGSHQHMWVLST